MKDHKFIEYYDVGDFVNDGQKKNGLIVAIDMNDGQRFPPMATILWPDGSASCRYQDNLVLVCKADEISAN